MVVAIVPWYRKSYFFIAFLAASVTKSVTLFALSYLDLSWAYTYVYWIGSGLLHGLAFGTAYDCFRQLFYPFRRLPRSFAYALLTFTTLLSIIVMVAHIFLPDLLGDLGGNLLTLDRSLTWWICGLMWLISTASDWLRIPWTARPYGIFIGFLFSYSVDVFVTAIRAITNWQSNYLLWPLGFATELICIAIWIFYFMQKEPELTTPSPQQLADVQRMLSMFRAAGTSK
jgi:hypothetical protein